MIPTGDFGVFASVCKLQRRVQWTDCEQLQCGETV